MQLSGGTIQNGTLTSTTAYDLQSGTASAVLAGAVGANKTTGGAVSFSGTGANTYSGTTTVSAGTLNLNKTAGQDAIAGNLTVSGGSVVLQANNQINNAKSVVVSGGTLDVATFNDTVAAVQLTSGNINGSGGTLTSSSAFDLQAGAVSAILGGTSGASKTGAGTITLSGSNSYTGTTTISAGTLAYGASNVLATGAVTVDGATAVLALGNNQSDTVGVVTVANGGSITGSGTSTLTSTGSFEMQSGSVSAILGGLVLH